MILGERRQTLVAGYTPWWRTERLVIILTPRPDPVGMAGAESWTCTCTFAPPQPVQNIERNPSVEVSVVDPLVRKGYRFKGPGVVHRSGDVFERGSRMYRGIGLTHEIRAVVLIRVERALPVFSPAYDRGDTEEQVKERWRRYGKSVGRRGEMTPTRRSEDTHLLLTVYR